MKNVFFLLILCLQFIFFNGQAQNPTFDWAVSAGSNAQDEARSIEIDINGNTYITGYFSGTVDFDPDSSGVFQLTSNGGRDLFVQKLDVNGNFLWAKSIGGQINDYGSNIALDANQNILITGGYSNTVDFDPGSGVFNLTSNGSSEAFILKLDSNGDFLWAKSFGGADTDDGISINVDQHIIVSGRFYGTSDFDPGTADFNLTSNGQSDVFILKLDISGNFLWAKSMGGSGFDVLTASSVDEAGSVYSIGNYTDMVDFDPGNGLYNLTSNGNNDIFIQKLDANGNFLWAKSIGGDL